MNLKSFNIFIDHKRSDSLNTASKLSDKLLITAFKSFASDIHFYPIDHYTHIYFRIHGSRVFYKEIPKQTYDLLLAYYKFTSGMDIGNTRKPQDGTIIYHGDLGNFSLRLSTLPINSSESLAIRILPQEDNLQLNQLFLFPNQL